MKPRFGQVLLPLAVLVILAGIVYFDQARRAETAALPRLDCPDPVAGCQVRLGERTVTLGMDTRPRAMRPFRVWVRAPGAGRVRAEFTMADMDMGLNLYTLAADKDGVFRARVTLPVCVTGRQDWLLTLDVDGERGILPFVISL